MGASSSRPPCSDEDEESDSSEEFVENEKLQHEELLDSELEESDSPSMSGDEEGLSSLCEGNAVAWLHELLLFAVALPSSPAPELSIVDSLNAKGVGRRGLHVSVEGRRGPNNNEESDGEAPASSNLSFCLQLSSILPKLVPFFKTLAVYFVVLVPEERPSVLAMLLKCLPVLSLALFVLLQGISLNDESLFARRILAGLLFSCLGDAFLIWPSYFLHGIVAFAVAQLFYIRAFGFDSLNWKIGFGAYISTAIGMGVILPGLLKDEVPILLAIPLYSFLLTTMVWRALSRVHLLQELWTWTKFCACFGGLSFAVSDTVLALDKFYADVPHSQVIVMVTYYLAQFGIALSVVNINSKAIAAKVCSSSKSDEVKPGRAS